MKLPIFYVQADLPEGVKHLVTCNAGERLSRGGKLPSELIMGVLLKPSEDFTSGVRPDNFGTNTTFVHFLQQIIGKYGPDTVRTHRKWHALRWRSAVISSRERQANEKEILLRCGELPVDRVPAGRCVRFVVFATCILSLYDSGGRGHGHLRFQQSWLLRLVPGHKATSAAHALQQILFAGPGVLKQRALHPDLLQCNDDPHRMEAREGRNGGKNAVKGRGRRHIV